MHQEALEWVQNQLAVEAPKSVIEIGSRDINGTARMPGIEWFGIDLVPGTGVDKVVDACYFKPEALVDCVVCCEVLEHAPDWAVMVLKACRWLKPGGCLLVTCAGPARAAHSAQDGGSLRPNEYYKNISIEMLTDLLEFGGLDGDVCYGRGRQDLWAKIKPRS